MLFLQAVDIKDRKDLRDLLEDPKGLNGLIMEWNNVTSACNRYSKLQQLVQSLSAIGLVDIHWRRSTDRVPTVVGDLEPYRREMSVGGV